MTTAMLEKENVILRESAEHYRVIYKNLPVPISIWKRQGEDFILVDYNDANREVVGMLGCAASVLYPDSRQFLHDLHDCYERQTTIHRELHMPISPTGEEIDLNQCFTYAQPDMVVVHTENVTEQRPAENAVLESEGHFSSMVRGSPIGINIFDIDTGVVVDCNAAFLELTGYSRQEIVNHTAAELNLFANQEDCQRLMRILHSEGVIRNYPATIRRKSGEERNTLISLATIESQRKNLTAAWHIDFTELKRVEAGLLLSQAELEQRAVERAAELQKSQQRLSNAVRAANVGFWDLDLSTNKVFFSSEYKKMLGYEDHEMSNDSSEWESRVHPEDIGYTKAKLEAFFQYPDEGYQNEFRMRHKDESYRWILARASIINDDQGRPARMLGSHIDITERKTAEVRIARLHRLYSAISQINQSMVKSRDRETLFKQICSVAVEHADYRMAWIGLVDQADASVKPVEFAGQEQGYLAGMKIKYLDPESETSIIGTCIREERCIICQDISTDLRITSRRERALARGYRSSAYVPLWQQARIAGIFVVYTDAVSGFDVDDEQLLNLIGCNISFALDTIETEAQRKSAEEDLRLSRTQLAVLTRQLIETHEAERRTIARELHDQIGQILTAMKITLAMAQKAPSEMTAQKLQQAQELNNDLLNRISNLSLELRPPMLDDLGLIPALTWHINRYQEQTGIQVEFTHNGAENQRFTTEIETTAYRILQEALTNVARHAHASNVKLAINVQEQSMEIRIEDNGIGFDVKAAMARNRGLRGMHERAQLVGGTFQLTSGEGKGTKKLVILPLQVQTT